LHVFAERRLGQTLALGREGLDDLLNRHPAGVISLDPFEIFVGPDALISRG
jgi:hypothetical protein